MNIFYHYTQRERERENVFLDFKIKYKINLINLFYWSAWWKSLKYSIAPQLPYFFGVSFKTKFSSWYYFDNRRQQTHRGALEAKSGIFLSYYANLLLSRKCSGQVRYRRIDSENLTLHCGGTDGNPFELLGYCETPRELAIRSPLSCILDQNFRNSK